MISLLHRSAHRKELEKSFSLRCCPSPSTLLGTATTWEETPKSSAALSTMCPITNDCSSQGSSRDKNCLAQESPNCLVTRDVSVQGPSIQLLRAPTCKDFKGFPSFPSHPSPCTGWMSPSHPSRSLASLGGAARSPQALWTPVFPVPPVPPAAEPRGGTEVPVPRPPQHGKRAHHWEPHLLPLEGEIKSLFVSFRMWKAL